MAPTTVCNDASRCDHLPDLSLTVVVCRCPCTAGLRLWERERGVGRLAPREEGATAQVVTWSSRCWCRACRTEAQRDYGDRRKAVTQGLLCTFLSYGVLISEGLSFWVCVCVCVCVCACVNHVIAYVDTRRPLDSGSRKRYNSFCVDGNRQWNFSCNLAAPFHLPPVIKSQSLTDLLKHEVSISMMLYLLGSVAQTIHRLGNADTRLYVDGSPARISPVQPQDS